jgi:methylenetetrahydrofolate--tRNA-(uracil-5-)-methyltransferase
MAEVIVIGAGLAGSEAAWQIAAQGQRVVLHEMRPGTATPAHQSGDFAELVCSNSLGSDLPDRAPGLLKAELRRLNSVILACADRCTVPAGGALAVDRDAFARAVTEQVSAHPLIDVRREEVARIPRDRPVVVASGPLTSELLAEDIATLTGSDRLHFFDAMAPIVSVDSVDETKVFRANRWGRGSDDYINCPMTHEEYDRFVDALLAAEKIPLREFERLDQRFFEACLPVEVIASRGRQALAFGPLRPVGLTDPRTGKRPWGVVQLRQDNLAGTLYNLVGFQTNLRWPEQERVFRLIPGLEHAEFVRFGQMHRNTFINSPALLEPTMQLRGHEGLYFAGQLVGTEGYMGSTASGLVAGINAARTVRGQPALVYPPETMLGALCRYVSSPQVADFQPMKPNFGLLPPLEASGQPTRKRDIHGAMAERALAALEVFLRNSIDG